MEVFCVNGFAGSGFFVRIFRIVLIRSCIFSGMYTNAVKFNFAFHRDYKTFASVNHAGFHEVSAFRIYVNYNVRSFDLESFGVCDIRSNQRRFFSCGDFVLFIKGLEFFFFHTAFFEESFYLGFGQDVWFRVVFVGFDQFG